MLIKKLILFLFILAVYQGKAQEIQSSLLSTSGDFFSNESYSISWSIGEIAIKTFTKPGNILTQGFQQTKLTTTSIKENPLKYSQVKLYPNPASEKLYLSFNSDVIQSYQLEIFDFIGSKKITEKIESGSITSEIGLNNLKPGTYMLVLKSNEGKTTNTFIFQKTD